MTQICKCNVHKSYPKDDSCTWRSGASFNKLSYRERMLKSFIKGKQILTLNMAVKLLCGSAKQQFWINNTVTMTRV